MPGREPVRSKPRCALWGSCGCRRGESSGNNYALCVNTATGIGVLDKVIRLLDLVESEPRSVSQLVAATGWPRPTCARLAGGMLRHGLLSRDSVGQFRLGPRMLGMTTAQTCMPILTELRDRTGESVQLFVARGSERLCVAAVESSFELRTIVQVGALLPLDKGSGGLALSQHPDVLKQGWVATAEDRAPDVASVSSPVRLEGSVLAAVCVSGPTGRMADELGERYAIDVLWAAAALERLLAADPLGGSDLSRRAR